MDTSIEIRQQKLKCEEIQDGVLVPVVFHFKMLKTLNLVSSLTAQIAA
jgi:hypothetical protein